MLKNATLALLAILLLVPAQARGQAWDAPAYLPPNPGDDIGIYLDNAGNFGIEGIWRQGGNLNLGLRVGYIDTDLDGVITVGAETWGGLVSAGATLPVDVDWTLGAGAAFNGGTELEIPAGVTIGLPLELDPVTIQIYGHPRLALFVFSSGDNTSTDLDALFDIGAQADINQNLKLRVAATFGGRDVLGIGVAYRWTRGATVR